MDIDSSVEFEIFVIDSRLGNDVVTSRDTEFHVDVKFSYNLVCCEYNDTSVPLEPDNVHHGFMTKSVRMDIEQIMGPESSLRTIARGLREWPVNDRNSRKLSALALVAAKDLMAFMPPQHNVLVIPIDVSILVVFNEHRTMEHTAQTEMVVDTDKYLETKTATRENKDQTCSICLDDFYAGCQVCSMPCSHVFHEDCIKRWLKSSHYFPLCRFELPTAC